MYYRNAQSALVVYDLTKPTSLVKAKHWVAELQRQASPGIVIGLVGNKLDLTNPAGSESSTSDEASPAAEAAADGTDESTHKGGADESSGDARKITTAEARTYAEEEGLLFFETSAKTGVNVTEVFTAIANAIPETSMKPSRGGGGGAGGQSGSGQGVLGADRVDLAGAREGVKEGCAC